MAALLCCMLAGCSGRQIYDTAAGWRRNECDRIVDAAERSRCLETADLDYDRYRHQRDGGGPER